MVWVRDRGAPRDRNSCRHVDVLPIRGNFHFLPYLFLLTFAMVKCLYFKTSYTHTQHVFSLYLVCAQFSGGNSIQQFIYGSFFVTNKAYFGPKNIKLYTISVFTQTLPLCGHWALSFSSLNGQGHIDEI